MFHSWKEARNKNPDVTTITLDIDRPKMITKPALCYALCHFITETRKINGQDYPPKPIYEMIVCMQMYLETQGLFWKLLDDKDYHFIQLHYTCDNLMKERVKSGMGTFIKQAQVLSYNDEKFLWENGYLGTDNPEQFVYTVLFVIGLYCALHAGAEHRNLRSIGFRSQLKYVFPDGGECHIIYTEDLGTKTNTGSLRHKKVELKQVTIFPDLENHNHCPVRLIYKYHSLLPMKRKCKALYLRPRINYSPGLWLQDMPIGVNKLHGFVKEITMKAGLDGYVTNHSLRSTAATHLYQGGVEEQVITEITGH